MEKSRSTGYSRRKFNSKGNSKQPYRRDPDAMDWQANQAIKFDKRPEKKKIFALKKQFTPKKRTMTDAQQKRYRNGKCLQCGNKGHYARECRNSGK